MQSLMTLGKCVIGIFGLHSKQLVELSLLAYICGSAPPCHSSKTVGLLSGMVPRYREKYAQGKFLQAAGRGGIKRHRRARCLEAVLPVNL